MITAKSEYDFNRQQVVIMIVVPDVDIRLACAPHNNETALGLRENLRNALSQCVADGMSQVVKAHKHWLANIL
jgi:hypothetical protein